MFTRSFDETNRSRCLQKSMEQQFYEHLAGMHLIPRLAEGNARAAEKLYRYYAEQERLISTFSTMILYPEIVIVKRGGFSPMRLFRGTTGLDFGFMNDNARSHQNSDIQLLLESEDIIRMDWPAFSPDLNPVEHVCDVLRTVGQSGAVYGGWYQATIA
ncbi:hypothetical protein TNCV_1723661 [Trichonephila clavipes]|nr:hypothetical protein TNCV_1723661 [Trichonephila clavipes]